ncbi:hypothetical protein DFH09DRAFT_1070806 [Mycena vulgaris]|nr:hypothetical protein DFH09DRAFT_1070806 [Mycena vulgaris]
MASSMLFLCRLTASYMLFLSISNTLAPSNNRNTHRDWRSYAFLDSYLCSSPSRGTPGHCWTATPFNPAYIPLAVRTPYLVHGMLDSLDRIGSRFVNWVFPASVYAEQTAWYQTHANAFGVPLDTRHTHQNRFVAPSVLPGDWEIYTAVRDIFVGAAKNWVSDGQSNDKSR